MRQTGKDLKIVKMKDKSDKMLISKPVIFDIPAKILVIGRSQLSGKSTWIFNALGRPEFYGNDFKGEDIYICSPSVNTEKFKKFIKLKKIPEENIFDTYDNEIMLELYDIIKEDFLENKEDGKFKNYFILFDDVGFSGSLRDKKNLATDKIFCNGRHYGISCAILLQKVSQASPCVRQNATGLVCFSCNAAELKLLTDENALCDKKKFQKEFRKATKENHDTFIINYSNKPSERYMKNFDYFLDLEV